MNQNGGETNPVSKQFEKQSDATRSNPPAPSPSGTTALPLDPKSVEGVFLEALGKQPGAARDAFLDAACQGNAELRTRVDALLRAYSDAGSFLQRPAGDWRDPPVTAAAGSPAVDSDERFQTAGEVAQLLGDALARLQAGRPVAPAGDAPSEKAPPRIPQEISAAAAAGGFRIFNPRLPKVAQWICAYGLAISPVLFALNIAGIIAFTLDENKYVIASETWDLPISLLVVASLFVGGLKLRDLRGGVKWLKAGFALQTAQLPLYLAVMAAWIVSDSEALTAFDRGKAARDFLSLSLVFVCYAFGVFALVWLMRNARSLPLSSYSRPSPAPAARLDSPAAAAPKASRPWALAGWLLVALLTVAIVVPIVIFAGLLLPAYQARQARPQAPSSSADESPAKTIVAGPQRIIRTFSPADEPISPDAKWIGDELEVAAAQPGSVRLFELPLERNDQSAILYRFRIKAEALDSGAYAEMWCRVAGVGEAFSRGLDQKVHGKGNWLTAEIPFFLQQDQFADLLRLNLAFAGPGNVRMTDIQVLAVPLAGKNSQDKAKAETPTDPPADLSNAAHAEAADIVWGKPSPQVQLGWRIEPKKATYRPGEFLTVSLFLRNVGQRPIESSMPRTQILEKLGLDVELRDFNQMPLPWKWGAARQSGQKVSGAFSVTFEPNAPVALPPFTVAVGQRPEKVPGGSDTVMVELEAPRASAGQTAEARPAQPLSLTFKLSSFGYQRGEEAELHSEAFKFQIAKTNIP